MSAPITTPSTSMNDETLQRIVSAVLQALLASINAAGFYFSRCDCYGVCTPAGTGLLKFQYFISGSACSWCYKCFCSFSIPVAGFQVQAASSGGCTGLTDNHHNAVPRLPVSFLVFLSVCLLLVQAPEFSTERNQRHHVVHRPSEKPLLPLLPRNAKQPLLSHLRALQLHWPQHQR